MTIDDDNRKCAPRTLTVVLADTFVSEIAREFEGEHRPYERRSVQIELTPEQREKLKRRKVGVRGGETMREVIIDCWLEPEDE